MKYTSIVVGQKQEKQSIIIISQISIDWNVNYANHQSQLMAVYIQFTLIIQPYISH